MAPVSCFQKILVILFITTTRATFDGTIFSGSSIEQMNQYSCTRLFHINGSIGCYDPSETAPVLPLLSVLEDDLPLLNELRSMTDFVAVVLEVKLFTLETLNLLRSTNKVGAIIALSQLKIDEDDKENCFSPDLQTPLGRNSHSSSLGIDTSYPWNKCGDGLMFEEIKFPVVLAHQSSSQHLREHVPNRLKSNDKPRWVTEMSFYFGSDKQISSKECLSWRNKDGNLSPKCLPLGGQSVWGTFSSSSRKPVVMAMAGIDSTALFHEASFGMNDAATSIIVLLTAIDALSKHPDKLRAASSTIGVSFLQAEEYGFIGSRKLAGDISHPPQCLNRVNTETSEYCLEPIYPSWSFEKKLTGNIQSIVAVDQLTLGSDLFIHSAPFAKSSTIVDAIVRTAAWSSISVKESSTSALPPSPLTSFVESNHSIEGVVLSGYNDEFIDPNYHSNFDTTTANGGARDVDIDSLVATSTFVANTLFNLATGDESSLLVGGANEVDFVINASLISSLISCLTAEGFSCSLISSYVSTENAVLWDYLEIVPSTIQESSPPSYYTSVLSSSSGLPVLVKNGKQYAKFAGDAGDGYLSMKPSILETFLRNFLASRLDISQETTSYKECSRNSDCPDSCEDLGNVKNGRECALGKCVCSLAFFHTAIDTSIVAEETPNIFKVIDQSQPSTPIFTEANWRMIGAKFYQKTGKDVEISICILGIASSLFWILFSRKVSKLILTEV